MNGLKQNEGFSLIEILVAIGLLALLTSAFLSMMVSQKQEIRSLNEDMARVALEASVTKAMTSSGICSFLISDPSQSSTHVPPNRTADVIDTSTDAILATQKISVRKIPAGPSISTVYLAEVNGLASPNSNGVVIESMMFHNFRRNGVDQYLADFRVTFKPPPVSLRPIKQITVKDLFFTGNSTTPANAKAFSSCSAPKGESPQLNRIYFTAGLEPSGGYNWVVPAGVRSALVTIAGGGGSGYGWRIGNALKAGDSGGFLISYPVALIPGETLNISVGRGAVSHHPNISPSSAWLYLAPTSGDDGYSGYPGTSSKIIRVSSSSPSTTILECAGGSGAYPGIINNLICLDPPSAAHPECNPHFSVPGNGHPYQPAHVGSGGAPYHTPTDRKASGPYANSNSPGHCGPAPAGVNPATFGFGFYGTVFFAELNASLPAGLWAGGRTPVGGSGGNVVVNGCQPEMDDPDLVGVCVFPAHGDDGIVIFDMLY